MSRRFERLEPHLPELDRIAIPHGLEVILSLRGGTQIYSRPRPVAKLQVTGEKVGMEMGEKYVGNLQPVLARKC